MNPLPLNVAEYLVRMALTEPDRAALHHPHHGVSLHGKTPYTTLTFSQLDRLTHRLATAFERIGIQRGVRTAVMVPPTPDFFAITFALFKIAAVPVLIDPGMGVKNLGRCLAEAEPQAFIGVPKAHLARRILGWGRRSIRSTVNVGAGRFFCHHSLVELKHAPTAETNGTCAAVQPHEMAAILFTSGSTGIAKGAVYTHDNFAAQVGLLKQTYGITPGEIDLCTFPLFALFGPALGMTCVLPDMNPSRPATIDPRKAAAQIRQFGVTNLFGSPAVIRRLGTLANRKPTGNGGDVLNARTSLASLRRVISAGAPASVAAIERLVTLLPTSTPVFTPYGATEALPVANIGSHDILAETQHLTLQGKGVCVGAPVTGIQVHVIAIHDEPITNWDDSLCLPVGEIGEFVVRGPVVTPRYYNRPEATRLAKIHDPKTGEVLHRMGDVGYLDDRGRLWFCGRKSHRVATSHGTLFTDMVEPILNTVAGVERTALVGVKHQGVLHPVVCFELDGTRGPDTIIADLQQMANRFEHTRSIRLFLPYRGPFPMDVRHNSKIFREKLTVWAQRVCQRDRSRLAALHTMPA